MRPRVSNIVAINTTIHMNQRHSFLRTIAKIFCPIVSLAILLGFAQVASAQSASPLAQSTQLLLVTTADWDTVGGTLHRFARADTKAEWSEIGTPIPIVVGRNGLGWGLGLNPKTKAKGPVKKEGDGKSPAGIFRLSSAFGFAAPADMKNIKLPYQQLTDQIECVDDVKSTNYNSVVDRGHFASPDWNSSEKMKTVGQYRLGVVVDHNTDPREPGSGSCIFLHIWKDAQTGTSGCTAMSSSNIDVVVPWLDPAANPVLVQLPNSDYHKLRAKWQLP